MKTSLFGLALLLSGVVFAAPTEPTEDVYRFPSPISEVTVFDPPANYTTPKTLYARTVELGGGILLATWENYSPEPPMVYFPIYRSADSGRTWKEISRVHDTVNGWGMRYQPSLYVLPEAMGGFPVGTILCAGNSIPTNLSNTQIDLYASIDKGRSWNFVSHVAAGGEAIPNNGLTPVWEPHMLYYKGQLIMYYSDQRDPSFGQKLVHQTSTDLKTWGEVVPDVEHSWYYARPGMTTVTHLPNGSYAMTYEYGGAPGFVNYTFAVYYRIADSPLDFNSSVSYPIVAKDGTVPESSPYITWSPVGGKHGTVIVSCGIYSELFINSHGAALGTPWKRMKTPESVSYTRHIRVFEQQPNSLLIMGGGLLPGGDEGKNKVTVSVINLKKGIARAID